MNEFGIKNDVYNEMLNVFKDIKEIETVVLFGSRAKNTFTNTSDIDLAVKFTASNKKLLLIRNLEDIKCILKFDVLDVDKISNSKLLNNINTEGVLIYRNN